MKKIIPFILAAIIVAVISCSKTNAPEPTPAQPIQPNQPNQPVLAITDFNPKSAVIGATVMITGTAFGTDASAVGVKFGTSASVIPTAITATSLNVVVPSDAKTGKIQLTVGGSTVTTTSDFTLTTVPPPAPTITSFTPQTASVGDIVTINGTNFGTDTNFVSVKFGTVAGIKPKTVSATTMTVVVPSAAVSGKIQIAVNGGIAVSTATDFTLKPKFTISGFAPKTFTEGDTVTITGTNFGTNINSVYVSLISGNYIRPYFVTPTAIAFIVPNEGGFNITNKITVLITGYNDVTTGDSFTYQLPVQATAIDQLSARAGEIVNITVQINHTNFGINVANLNSLSFNFGTSAAVTPLSAGNNGMVAVRVPSDATSGKIKAAYVSYHTGTSTFAFTKLAALPTPQSGTWTAGPDFKTTSGRVGSISFVIGSKAYVGLGSTNAPFDGVGNTDFWEFDPQYNAWTQKADYAGGRRANAAAFAIGSKGYVGTGQNENNAITSDFWEYDPATNQWSQKADFKGGVRTNAVGFAIGSLGYVGAGGNTSTSLTDFYSYNPTSNSWAQTASIPGARSKAYSFVVGNNAYVGNGYNSNTINTLLDMYMYDPTANTWTAKASTPYSSYGSAAFSISDKGYIGTGYNNSNATTDKFYQYSTTTNTWTALPNYGGGVRTSAVAFAVNNIGYIGMGTTFSNIVATKDFWAYKP